MKDFSPKPFTLCTFVRKEKVEMIDSTLVKFKTFWNIFSKSLNQVFYVSTAKDKVDVFYNIPILNITRILH